MILLLTMNTTWLTPLFSQISVHLVQMVSCMLLHLPICGETHIVVKPY
jgi:hypothetical protein